MRYTLHMDIPWGDPKAHAFVTNVGLITSDGPNGPNVMSCEWTHHVSYKPGLIAVCLGPDRATHENIAATKEFGVHIAASDQNVLASVAGNNKGKQTDKVGLLKEMGFTFKKAKQIKAPMLEGALLTVECSLKEQHTLGDHTMFVGEVLEVELAPEKEPLLYHKGKYWKIGAQIPKPTMDALPDIAALKAKYQKK